MTALLRLYPRRWRDRYEIEFLGLLESRPPSVRDRVDIVRGALDARLHGEVPGSADGPTLVRRPARLLAMIAAIAGAAWLAWMAVLLLLFKGWGSGQPDLGILAGTPVVAGLTMAVAHAALAMTAGGIMRPGAVLVASLTAVVFGLGTFTGGPLLLGALIGSAVVATDGIGDALPGWIRISWLGSAVAVIIAMLAFTVGGGQDVSLLAGGIPFGVVWLLIAVTVGMRGIPVLTAAPMPGATHGPIVEA